MSKALVVLVGLFLSFGPWWMGPWLSTRTQSVGPDLELMTPVYLPLIYHSDAPAPVPTPTPTPMPTPTVCRPQPRNWDAAQLILSVQDIPTQYGMLMVEEGSRIYNDPFVHSEAGREFESSMSSSGPIAVMSESFVLCSEPYAQDFWPEVVKAINDHVATIGTPNRTEIKFGEQNHARYVYVGWYVYYVSAFRQDNAVGILQAVGFRWEMTESQVRGLVRRMHEKTN